MTCTVVLGLIYPLGLRGAVSRTWYEEGTLEERRQQVGTQWIAMVLAAAAMALALDRAGPWLAAALLPEVPFRPYLRLAVWTAFFSVFGITPLVVLQAQERPRPYVVLTVGTALVTTVLSVWLVLRGRGAEGYLLGALLGSAAAAVCYLAITLRQVRPVWRSGVLLPALAFSLPLVPHAVAGWALEMSDRAILSRMVPLHDVGVYSLGYQLGAAMGLFTNAFNAAWVPFLFGALKEEGEAAHPRLARLVTYYAFVLCFVGLGWALLVEHALPLLAGPEFQSAYRITPWVSRRVRAGRTVLHPHEPALLAPADAGHSPGDRRRRGGEHRSQPLAGASVRSDRRRLVHAGRLRAAPGAHLVASEAPPPLPL